MVSARRVNSRRSPSAQTTQLVQILCRLLAHAFHSVHQLTRRRRCEGPSRPRKPVRVALCSAFSRRMLGVLTIVIAGILVQPTVSNYDSGARRAPPAAVRRTPEVLDRERRFLSPALVRAVCEACRRRVDETRRTKVAPNTRAPRPRSRPCTG